MGKIYKQALELIGNTPLLELQSYRKAHGLAAIILAKLEYLNPSGSVKDRAAKGMIEAAERKGEIREGAVLIEPTSGNTGIGLAALAAVKGYRMILTMPETMSAERIKLLKAYGAEVILTEGAKGMNGAIAKAKQLAADIPNSFIPGQFDNPENAKAHKDTTGPEIYRDTEGNVDIFVAGVGTGGTITGIGEYLKEQNPEIRIVAVEPEDSPVLSGGKSGAHGMQGIGAGFIPAVLNQNIYEEVITISKEEAYQTAREIAKLEGILVGISSGAALKAAMKLAERVENEGKTIVVLLPDTGDRYLSMDLF